MFRRIQEALGGENCFWVITLPALCIKSGRRSMASWQTQTIRDFLCHAPLRLDSTQVVFAWLCAWVGQDNRTELRGWHRAILTVSLLNCSRLPRDQGNTQLSLLTKSMVPWEMLGRRLCFTNKQQGKRGHWIRMCPGAS